MHINNALHEELASDPTGANFATIENSKNPTFPDNHIDIRKWRNESHDRKQSLRAVLRTLIKIYTFAPNFKFGTK